MSAPTTGSARAEVLARLRSALTDAPAVPEVPRAYRQVEPLGSAELLDLFADRVDDYRATVHRCRLADVPATLAAILARHDARRVGVPPGLDPSWVPGAVVDDGLGIDELDALDGAVTGAAVGIAQTGTFVLDAGPEQGRRALTLVPDLHVCVVRASQVVHLVPEAVARLDASRPLTFVSGPSATSDIELNRVEGVHGPRRLEVVIVDDA